MPPARLYKYQSFSEYSIDNLARQKIFFSKPGDFNDPFEFRVTFERRKQIDRTELVGAMSRHLLPSELRELVGDADLHEKLDPDHILKGVAHDLEQYRNGFQQRGVACFSEEFENSLMWAHYAAGHTGFCLEFSTDSAPFTKLLKVDYLSRVPNLDPADFVLTFDDERIRRTLMASKFNCWSYEREWRCFHLEGGTAFGYKPQDLTGVYFGLRMKEGHRTTICWLLQKTPTELFEMVETEGGYGVRAVPGKFDLIDYTGSA